MSVFTIHCAPPQIVEISVGDRGVFFAERCNAGNGRQKTRGVSLPSGHAHSFCCSVMGCWRGTRRARRPGLSASPASPASTNLFTHLETKRRLIPPVAAASVIVTPSASSKIIRPRLARPAEMVVARCHARSVWRCAGVRRIVNKVLRPYAIQRPHRQSHIEHP